MPESTCVYDVEGVERLRRALRLDPMEVKAFRKGLFKKFRPTSEVLHEFPGGDRLRVHPLTLFRRVDSAIDGATKLLFQTSTGMLIESVILRIGTGRTTLCVSSQIGCAAACSFCATGKMGIARNLSAAEILDQFLQASQIVAGEGEGATIRNLVFMGMGEPLHNEMELVTAIERLTSADFFHHPPSKIIVSTVGIADGMRRLAERFPKVNLALSLHSVRTEVRERLIPVGRRYPLPELRETIRGLNDRFGATVMIEYLLLGGVNDSLEDARELAEWLRGLQVHVNLIPYNPIDEAPELAGSPPEAREAFANILKSAGYKTTTRYSLGGDIEAACGQLVRHENRIRAMSAVGTTVPLTLSE